MILIFNLIVINFCILVFYSRISKFINIYDKPDKKIKLHNIDVSLIGGPIIYFNIFIFLIYSIFINDFSNFYVSNGSLNIYIFLFTGSAFFLIGLIDDKLTIDPKKKFILFIILILLLLFLDPKMLLTDINIFNKIYRIDNLIISYLFTVFCFLAFINAFNFFDGINLQVGFYTIFLILVFISKNLFFGFWIIFLISVITYLILNYRNKIFLGDSGSLFISFIFSYFFIFYHNNFNIFSADEIFLLMLLPGIDMVRLVIVRLYSGKNPLFGDRQHFHHLIGNRIKGIKLPFISLFLCSFPYVVYLILDLSLLIIIFSLFLYMIIYLNLKKS